MTAPVIIGNAALYLGDCLEVMRTLEPVDQTISDPPYEAVMQNKWGVLSRNAPSSHVQHEEIGFEAIDEIRDDVARAIVEATNRARAITLLDDPPLPIATLEQILLELSQRGVNVSLGRRTLTRAA